MDEQTIRAALEVDAVPILPRDCDGGLSEQHGSASGVNLDDRCTTTDAEADNTAEIARDLEEIAERVRRLSFGTYANWRVLARICGTLKGAAGTLQNLQLTRRHPDERIGLADESPRDQLARLASQLSSINDQLKRLIPQLDSWGDHYHCCELARELVYRLPNIDKCLAGEYYGGKVQLADRECYAALGITQQ